MKQYASSNLSNNQRKGIYRRDGFRCALCDSTDGIQIHHFVPRGKGGLNKDENLICLCRGCHALAHGVDLKGITDKDQEAITQDMVEYLSDYYVDMGLVWNPWGNWKITTGFNESAESSIEYAVDLALGAK